MKLLVLADIHGHLENIDIIHSEIQECEGVVLAGDITDFGGRNEAMDIIAALGVYGRPLLAVPGNCDLPGVGQTLRQNKINLHGACIKLDGFQFVGAGGSLPGSGTTPNEAGEKVFGDTLEKAVAGVVLSENLVLVTHQPAWGCALDHVGEGRHSGSHAIRTFIERYQPILAISGHLHEVPGVDNIGLTTLVNPGPFRQGRYAVVEINDRKVQVRLYP